MLVYIGLEEKDKFIIFNKYQRKLIDSWLNLFHCIISKKNRESEKKQINFYKRVEITNSPHCNRKQLFISTKSYKNGKTCRKNVY